MEPIHPVLVHFPIVLTLIGSFLAVLTALFPRGRLPHVTVLVLALAALGCFAAIYTGHDAERIAKAAGQVTDAIEDEIEVHQGLAERTSWTVTIAALFAAGGAVMTTRGVRGAATLRILAACVAIGAAFLVHETGERGGNLVVRHGLGSGPPRPDLAIEGFGAVSESSTGAAATETIADDTIPVDPAPR